MNQNNSDIIQNNEEIFYIYNLILTLLQQCYSIIGFIFDAFVTYITIKNKSLHKSYGYLLGICSFLNTLMDTTNFLPTFLVLTKKQISMEKCFWLQAYGSILDINAPFCLLFISIDRLISFIQPIFYLNCSKKNALLYVLLANSISMFYVLIVGFFTYKKILENNNILTFCEPGDIFLDEIQNILSYSLIIPIFISLIIYLIILKLIKVNINKLKINKMTEQIKINRQIIKSLLLIVSIIVVSYLIFSISLQLAPLIISDLNNQYLIIHLSGQLLAISSIIDAPVLYFCSSEYRKAIQKDLPLIKKLAKKFNWKIEDSTKIKSIIILKSFKKLEK